VPTRQGFDFFFGYLDQKQAHPHDPASYEPYRGLDYAMDFITREAIGFVKANREVTTGTCRTARPAQPMPQWSACQLKFGRPGGVEPINPAAARRPAPGRA
jgi:hypothetical protein